MNKIPLWLIIGLITVAFLGFLDATYLTVKHFSGTDLNCYILDGCNEVTNSEYAEIFGIPVALFGALYYLTVMVLSILYLDLKKKFFLKLIPFLTTFGFLFSIILIYLMLYVIDALCIYCLGSAFTSTLLFILSIILFKKLRANSHV